MDRGVSAPRFLFKGGHTDIHRPEPTTSQIDWEKRARKAEKELKDLRKINKQKIAILEQRQKIDVRTNILRASLSLNTGLIAGLIVHFLTR